jgi:hypothetical protein
MKLQIISFPRQILFFLLLLLGSTLSYGQISVVHTAKAILPDTLNESSGLEYVSDTSIWSNNDSGDPGQLMRIDTAGNLKRILHLKGVDAEDMEELAQDSAGWFYVGDFGNNFNMRTNLLVYKIPPPDTILSDSVAPQIINFDYADQRAFPPDSLSRNFDCEAMFHFNNALYLFSKNRGTSTYSRMYRLPDTQGTYAIQPIDSFNTQQWVTSADISPSKQRMVLFSEYNIYVFTNFTGDQFFQGSVVRLTLSPYTQKEAVVFANDSILYLTDEIFQNTGGQLYTLNLNSILNSVSPLSSQQQSIRLYPNPTVDQIEVNTEQRNFEWILLDADGRQIDSGIGLDKRAAINTQNLAQGLYFLRIQTKEGVIGSLPFMRMR